jgi:putative tryptophan/tyrosine transport system substrate-binding protein
MDRRRFLLTSLAGALASPLAAAAQQGGKVYSIGVLSTLAGPSPTYGPVFSSALRDSGYELGRNLVIESRYAAGKVEQLPDLAADLVRRKVDIILAFGASESLAAVKTTATIPIVFTSPSPVELGLVRSLARPGGNATGLSADVTPEIAGKLLELLKMAVPSLSRIVGLAHSDRPALPAYEQALRRAAQTLRVEARLVGVRHEGDFDAAFAKIAGDRPDALMLAADPLIFLHRKRITDFAVTHALPTVAGVRDFVDDGGLMSYGPNFGDLLRQVVHYTDRILRGAKPADLPVEQPTKFELVINLKTAKALGLTIPPALLARADQVIE